MKNKIKYIRIIRDNRCLLRMKLQRTPGRYMTDKGEVDIIIDAAKKNFFEIASLVTNKGIVQSPEPINAVSWHGFFDEREGLIKPPVINFKNNHKKVWCPRHTGGVKQENLFSFPVCSIYIPALFNTSSLPPMNVSPLDALVEIRNQKNVRVDFFVLPKGISYEDYILNFSISIFDLIADISLFNKAASGEFVELPIASPEDVEFHSVKIEDWNTLIRLVYSDQLRESKLMGTYSILFHDPNNPIDMILNRNIGYIDENGNVILERLRDKHNEEVKRFIKKEKKSK
ncbi:hypothetical protein [Thermicanus aegyptius]|uniref:hypothetical protein n=1 Tax=Thermicanus aegyptius TaxID=94009 RepID=UPI0003FF2CE8|nr:hypothetical protein [Thermicanus aegyptius]